MCLHVDLQPGCFAYTGEPSSVVSASERMEAGKAFAHSAPMALHIGSILITPETMEMEVLVSMRS